MAFISNIPVFSKTAQPSTLTSSRRPPLSLSMSSTNVTTRVSTAPTPLSDRVLVRPDAGDEKSAGGILLRGAKDNKKSRSGTVVAVGPGRFSPEGVREDEAVNFFQPGDKVMWKDDFGSETIEKDGESYLALRVFSLVAKYETEN